MAHKNDVIFTEQGLSEFIQSIRQNPEMVYKVRAATDEEIAQHNETHLTLAEGRIPGKGITIIQANGDKALAAVGSDVKPLPGVQGKYGVGDPGTITFIVDETEITIPVDGIVEYLNDKESHWNEIPNSQAVSQYIADKITALLESIDKILNGGESNYGFIPGKYESIDQRLTAEEQSSLNSYLQQLNISNVNGIYSSSSGVVYNNGIIAKPRELIGLINNRIEEFKDSDILEQYNTELAKRRSAESMITSLENQNIILEESITQLENETIPNLEQAKREAEERKNNLEIELKQGLVNYGLPLDTSSADLETALLQQSLILINDYKLFNNIGEIDYNSVVNKRLNYTASNEEYNQLNKWLGIYGLQYQMSQIQSCEDVIVDLESQVNEKNEELSDLKEQKDSNNIKITNQEVKISEANTNIDNIQDALDEINDKIQRIAPAALALIDDGADRIWDVIKTQKSDEIVSIRAEKVYGAVYNDYAEYRNIAIANPGYVVIENGDGSLSLATKRLQLGANIVSDTYGFAIGKTDNAKTPIAVCGRVLAYPYEERKLFTPGAAVCSGPNGTISLMTREEIREWPDAIVGYVSEIPTYEYWGTDNIKVDGRIWIKVK